MKIDLTNSKIEPSFDGLHSTTGGHVPSTTTTSTNGNYYVSTPINWGSGSGSGAGSNWTITNPGQYTINMPSEVETLLADFLTKVRGFSQQKLEAIGVVFKKSLIRYKAADRALNIIREVGFYSNLVDLQESLWDELAPKVGYKNYNVRDAIWDAMTAQLIKNDITQKEFVTLTTPYGVTLISER